MKNEILDCQGYRMATENDAYRKISAQSRNLGILNKSLEILGSLHVEPSRRRSRIFIWISESRKLHPLFSNIMYLLTEREGRTGKYLARGLCVRAERSEVRVRPRLKYFPVLSDLTQSISILSYDHLLLNVLKKILFEPK